MTIDPVLAMCHHPSPIDDVLHTYISYTLLQATDIYNIYMMKGTLGSSAKFHELFPLIFQTPTEPYSFVYVTIMCLVQRAITVRNL